MITPSELTCEYAANPLGIDEARPRFTWILESERRGQIQAAYQVLVAGSPEKLAEDAGDKWDSGRVESDKSVNIVYEGGELTGGERCWWKVRVWDVPPVRRSPDEGESEAEATALPEVKVPAGSDAYTIDGND